MAPPLIMMMTIPVIALEDWTNAVMTIPKRYNKNGLLNEENIFEQAKLMSGFWKDDFMISSEKKMNPKPVRISPIFLHFSLLIKVKMTPMNAKRSK